MTPELLNKPFSAKDMQIMLKTVQHQESHNTLFPTETGKVSDLVVTDRHTNDYCNPSAHACQGYMHKNSLSQTILLSLTHTLLVLRVYYYTNIIPYPRKKGPMGGAPYIGPRLGGGMIFEVSVLCLDAKERPGKLPTLSS